jgi:hypothetical protein
VGELVGSTGAVVGIDRAAAAIVRDKARAEGQGMSNVQFLEADPTLIRLDDGFVAIASRLILMYDPDPIDAQRIRDEVRAEDTVVVAPLLIGASVRHPGLASWADEGWGL